MTSKNLTPREGRPAYLVPRPAGFEPPRVEAPGPSRAGAGLGSASPAWPAPGLVLPQSVPPLLEAAARPRVSGPAARDLTRGPALDAGGGWGGGRSDSAQALGECRRRSSVETTPSADSHETRLAPLWDSRPRDVNVGLRQALEDPVEMRRHPLGVVTVVVVAAIILIGGFFLRLPPLPGLRSMSLQGLSC